MNTKNSETIITKDKSMSLVKKRSIGMIIIEAIGSNPNGNPDEDNMPRTLADGHGLISPVCEKHHIREQLEDHNSVTWEYYKNMLDLDEESFSIWESQLKGYDSESAKEAKVHWRKLIKDKGANALLERFWDMRVFGTTMLEKKEKKDDDGFVFTRTGCVSISPLISLKPVEVIAQTITKANPLREELLDKNQGDIAPFAFKADRHAIFVGTYVINPARAHLTGTTEKDIEVFKVLITKAFSNSTSACRPCVKEVQVIHAEHDNPIGSFNENELMNFCRPVPKCEGPSTSMSDYSFVSIDDIKKQFPNINVSMLIDSSKYSGDLK